MTVNQLNYLRYLEDQRANQAREAETYRSNLAREAETMRSNQAAELQRLLGLREENRSNLARERETNRSNLVNEGLKEISTHYDAMASKASAALADAKTEGQGLQNYVTRVDSLNDKGAVGSYLDEYYPYAEDPLEPGNLGDSIINAIPRVGTGLFNVLSGLGDVLSDFVKPITNLFG